MTEAELLALVCGRAAELGIEAFHVPDSRLTAGRGFPDLVLAGPAAVAFAELKSDRGRLSVQQWIWQGRLIRAGAVYWLWRPADWASGAIEAALLGLA